MSDIAHFLAECPLFRGLAHEDLRRVADSMRRVEFRGGDLICRQSEPGESLYIVRSGRARATINESIGPPRVLGYLERGDHFGEMALLTHGRRTANVEAVSDADMLELGRERFVELLESTPRFAANLSRTLGYRLDMANARRKRNVGPQIVAFVHDTPRSRSVVTCVARYLTDRGRPVMILDAETPSADGHALPYDSQHVPAGMAADQVVDWVRLRLRQDRPAGMRVLLIINQREARSLATIFDSCDEILWIVDAVGPQAPSQDCYRELLRFNHRVKERLHVVWVLGDEQPVAPDWCLQWNLEQEDFKLALAHDPIRGSLRQRQGTTRLARHLNRTRIGLALGGGGARGLAHLGVLRVLDREDIGFDLIAGTSSGAMMGLAYAGGQGPDAAIGFFESELTPPRLVRALPAGNHWYLWTMFRIGAWEHKLRKYFHDWKLGQLEVPLSAMTVDLIDGRQIIRDREDAVHAILESINLPMISRPILRDGMVLVDGGILNNLAADVLVQKGADVVIGVDVVAKLARQDTGQDPAPRDIQRYRSTAMETLLRVTEVQGFGLNRAQAKMVDLLITPDTTPFEFADFSSARGLADAGEAAAIQALPQLKAMLAELEQRG